MFVTGWLTCFRLRPVATNHTLLTVVQQSRDTQRDKHHHLCDHSSPSAPKQTCLSLQQRHKKTLSLFVTCKTLITVLLLTSFTRSVLLNNRVLLFWNIHSWLMQKALTTHHKTYPCVQFQSEQHHRWTHMNHNISCVRPITNVHILWTTHIFTTTAFPIFPLFRHFPHIAQSKVFVQIISDVLETWRSHLHRETPSRVSGKNEMWNMLHNLVPRFSFSADTAGNLP